jgi:enoyl-CoA hydratase
MSEIAAPPPEGRVRVERRGAVMLIGIDRPAKLNGFTPEMIHQLSQAYQRFEDDAHARAAVLHAFGPHFSAGLQLDLFVERLHTSPLSTVGLVDPFQLRPVPHEALHRRNAGHLLHFVLRADAGV